MTGGVFVSYRRSDSAAFAGRIADFFAYRYPDVRVFFDATAIAPGENFPESIRAQVASSGIVLAVIGEGWLDAKDRNGRRRIDNPRDFVRMELSTALEMGALVIPVLLENARMPEEVNLPPDLATLAFCNAEYMRGAAFQRDADHLASFVIQHLAQSDKVVTAPPQAPARRVDSRVKAELVKAFEHYRDDFGPDAFMICENSAAQFVQFVKYGLDGVTLDLPSQALNPLQLRAARTLLDESYGALTSDLGDGNFSYQLSLPLEPAYLSHICLDVFEHVYGAIPIEPVKVTIEA